MVKDGREWDVRTLSKISMQLKLKQVSTEGKFRFLLLSFSGSGKVAEGFDRCGGGIMGLEKMGWICWSS